MLVLYTANRITDGLVPYKDITIIYGPVVYYFNSFLINFGLDYPDLKLVMIIVSMINGILIYSASLKIFNKKSIGILSLSIYMFSPMHYGNAPLVHVDQLAVLQSLIILNLILLQTKKSFFVAGITGALLFLTKVISVPFAIAPIIYFIINHRVKGIYYVISLFSITIFSFVYIKTFQTHELTNFLFDYILSNPDNPFVHLRSYFWIEGFVALIGFCGLLLFIKKYGLKHILVIFSIFSLIPFFSFMIKGTGIYSASYMEPFIAILAAYFIYFIVEKWRFKTKKIRKIIVICVIITIFVQFTIFDFPGRERHADWQGDRWFSDVNEHAIMHEKLIKEHTKENQIVVASPMAAFQTNRILALDDEPYFDILKFKNEILEYDSVDERLTNYKEMIKNKEIKIIISGNTTRDTDREKIISQLLFYYPFDLPEFQEIIVENYEKYYENGYYYYIPK